MYQPSNGFIDTLRWGTYLVAAQITVYTNNMPTSIILAVSDAQFTVDRNSEYRRQGEITLEILPTVPPQTVTIGNVPKVLLPLNPQAILAPFGNEIFVEMTVIGPGGTVGDNGWVPLGIYEIATTTVQDTGIDLTMTLELYDRSWAVAQRLLLNSYTVPATLSGSLQDEVEALLRTAWGSTPPWTYNIVPSSYTVPAGTYNQGQDPWQAALDMATSAGYELFFNLNGNVVAQPVPNPQTQQVVWNFVEGEVSAVGTFKHPLGGTPYTTPVDVAVTMTRDGIPNDFIVSASGPNNATGSNTPVQASAADTNPQSPTYINGPMGNIPNFIYDSLITTQAQALAEAQYDLSVSLAKSWTIAVDTPPNPLFDIDDVCTVTRDRLGLNAQKFVVDTITTSVRYDSVSTISGRTVT